MEKVHVEIEKLQDNGLYVNCRDIKMFFTNIIQEDFANIEIFMLNSNPSPDRLPHNMKHKMGISNFVLYK